MMKKQQYLYKLEDLGYFRSGYSARKKAEIVDAQVATHRLLPIRAMPEVNPYHIDWLRQLKVPVPTFEIQQKIIDLEALHWQEKELCQKLETKREQLYEALTMKIIESHS
ncbi:MAG: hypothetical protein QNJ64_11450 [Crocosphaera sp.]|nr:hypothetical protein [Crocosphaera sp.]